jgi:hypothetical protein
MPAWQVPHLSPVARVSVAIARPLIIGKLEAGLREVIPITGGTVEGPLLKGKVLPGGADWCLTRGDGVAEIWARYTIALDDGPLVAIINSGLAHPQTDGSYRGRTVPQFELAPGPYDWLRDSIFIGTLLAHASGDQVDLEFFRVD